MKIHPTAIVDPGAQLAGDVEVGPYSVIGPGARIGEGTVIANGVTILGRTTIGRECGIQTGSIVGSDPQDLKFRGEESSVLIGDRNKIREYVTVHRGTSGGGGVTVIGDDNLIMAQCHVAHDCRIGSGVVMANFAALGGHVVVEDRARLSGHVGVHHFVSVGELAFVGGLAKVVQDVPPYMMADGHPAKIRGLNLEGLRRAHLSQEAIAALKEAYRLLYRAQLSRTQAMADISSSPAGEVHEVRRLLEFLGRSERGRQGRAMEAFRGD